jgi:hypothetical protein
MTQTFHYMLEEDFSTLLDISGYRGTQFNSSPWVFEFSGVRMQLGFERDRGLAGRAGRMKWNIVHPEFRVLFEPNDMPSVPPKPEPSYGLAVKGNFDTYLKFIAYLRLVQ